VTSAKPQKRKTFKFEITKTSSAKSAARTGTSATQRRNRNADSAATPARFGASDVGVVLAREPPVRAPHCLLVGGRRQAEGAPQE
jgi:hypothetical protein